MFRTPMIHIIAITLILIANQCASADIIITNVDVSSRSFSNLAVSLDSTDMLGTEVNTQVSNSAGNASTSSFVDYQNMNFDQFEFFLDASANRTQSQTNGPIGFEGFMMIEFETDTPYHFRLTGNSDQMTSIGGNSTFLNTDFFSQTTGQSYEPSSSGVIQAGSHYLFIEYNAVLNDLGFESLGQHGRLFLVPRTRVPKSKGLGGENRPTSVPEPSALLLLGMLALWQPNRRR